jgi:DNA adenine methylase
VFHSNPKCETRPDLNRAYDYFITSWLGMNGVAGTWPPRISFCARFQGDGGDPAVRFQSVISSIPQWRRRMRSTFVLCRDGFKIIPRVGDQSASAMYVDPPYLDKSARYIHDFTSDDPDSNDPLVRKHGQHGLLARQLHRFEKTRVVLSYYDHPALAELYPSWSIIRLKAGGMSNAQVGRTPGNAKSKKQEVLLMNGPVLGGGLFDESLPGEPLQP